MLKQEVRMVLRDLPLPLFGEFDGPLQIWA
jgi:hypothetical protein